MENTFEIPCPKCNVLLIVDRITGKVIETREPLVETSTGDRFADSLKRVKESSQKAEALFEQSRQAEKNKHKDLDDLFNKSLEQAKKEGPVTKQMRDIDFE